MKDSTIGNRIRSLARTVRQGVERFPLTVCFAAALTVIAICLEQGALSSLSNNWKFFLSWYTGTGIALSLSLSLWLEDHKESLGRKIAVILIHILWFCISLLLKNHYDMIEYAPYNWIVIALIIALVASLPILPFIGGKSDVSFWNFTLRCLGAVSMALLVSAIVCGGLELLMISLEKLFGADISSHVFVHIASVCFIFLFTILAIQGIPAGSLKHDSNVIPVSGFHVNVTTRLFMPIAAAYLITLYCYAAKILFTWQLPDGWVSWLVTVSMAAMVILIMTVYPYVGRATQSTSAWNRMAIRFITGRMPILMLPLLLLMSIGIARRVSDYGITILRIYLVAFNLWCYAVCLVLIFKRNAGIIWIPASFAVAFAVITLLPVNVSTCVRKNLTGKVTAILQENGWNGTAMGDDEYGKFLSSLDSSVSHKLDSRIDYLKSQFSRQSVKDIIDTDVLTGRIPEHQFEDGKDGNVEIHRYRSILGNTGFDLPQEASRMCLYDYNMDLEKECIKDDILTVRLPLEYETDGSIRTLNYEFRIPLSRLRALENEMTPDNIARNDFNHVVSLTGTIVDASVRNAPASITLFLDTFHVRLGEGYGYFGVTGPLFY